MSGLDSHLLADYQSNDFVIDLLSEEGSYNRAPITLLFISRNNFLGKIPSLYTKL